MGLTERQLELRRSGIGASEIATLAGLNPWGSPLDIWAEKVGKATRAEASLRMQLGNLGEEPIAALYAERTGHHLLPCDTLRHPTRTIHLATPDRLVFDEPPPKGARPKEALRLLQIKWTSMRLRHEWGPAGTDEVPNYYQAQVQWEMSAAENPRADVATLFDRDAFDVWHLELDAELVEGLAEIAERFWTDYVLTLRPPPPDASERYCETLTRLFPRERMDSFIESTPELDDLAIRLQALEAQRKALDADHQLLCNSFRAAIGDAEGVETALGRITWKANRPRLRTDWEKLARQMAVIFEKARLQGVALPRLADLVRQHTTEEPGSRVLRKPWARK